ncbi:hypothetical protein B0A52_07532 [Exophiala mesophila]|uniref:Uncharacterized protein n=1 Tax=Exophiala mesophila TaxID=212818 RepID=A0A438MYQ4_EXOME|nr:hypothetical protein B0A52_07532 [Exophiala mesophila]
MCHSKRSRHAPIIVVAPNGNGQPSMMAQPQYYEFDSRRHQRRCRHGQPCTCPDNQAFMTDGSYTDYNDPYQMGYGACYGRRRRRQGPISMLIGGIISMVEQKRAEKEAVRAAEALEDSDDSTDSNSDEDEKTRAKRQQKKLRKQQQQQQQGVTMGPSGRASVPVTTDTNTIAPVALKKPPQQQDSKADIHWESGPPPYRP